MALKTDRNPFKHSFRELESVFTDTLQNHKDYEWAIKLSEDLHSTRGNVTWSEQLNLFSKPQHVAIGTLRSFPLQQMRKLMFALHEETLPLDDRDVCTIMEQAIFQIGEIADGSSEFMWKKDVVNPFDWICFYEVLFKKADILKA